MRATTQLHKKGALKPPLWHEDSPGAPDSGRDRLPHPRILGTLIDAMRVTLRGDVGWRLCPPELDRQPALFAYPLR